MSETKEENSVVRGGGDSSSLKFLTKRREEATTVFSFNLNLVDKLFTSVVTSRQSRGASAIVKEPVGRSESQPMIIKS
jgi:ADP-glucose pyrophosphorylase